MEACRARKVQYPMPEYSKKPNAVNIVIDDGEVWSVTLTDKGREFMIGALEEMHAADPAFCELGVATLCAMLPSMEDVELYGVWVPRFAELLSRSEAQILDAMRRLNILEGRLQ
jgi:hypothetical protein